MAGFVRLAGVVAGGSDENARFFASPLPVVVHILSATLFCLMGAFQFSAELRRYSLSWHRNTGRVLVLCGLLAGLSGL